MGLPRCEVTTGTARFDTCSWGNGVESALDDLMARSQAKEKEGKRRERKGGNDAHGGAVV
jgi:hypothetical protein